MKYFIVGVIVAVALCRPATASGPLDRTAVLLHCSGSKIDQRDEQNGTAENIWMETRGHWFQTQFSKAVRLEDNSNAHLWRYVDETDPNRTFEFYPLTMFLKSIHVHDDSGVTVDQYLYCKPIENPFPYE